MFLGKGAKICEHKEVSRKKQFFANLNQRDFDLPQKYFALTSKLPYIGYDFFFTTKTKQFLLQLPSVQ